MINYNALDIIVDAQGFPVSQYFSEEHGEFAVETTDGSLVLRSDVNFRLKTLILDRDGFPLPQLWDPEIENFVPRTRSNVGGGGGLGEINSNDVTTALGFTPVSSNDVTWNKLLSKPSTFAPAPHSHNYIDLIGAPGIGENINLSSDGLINVKNASTTTKGVVQLNNTTDSTSTTTAATSNSVKIVKDSLDNHLSEKSTLSKLGHVKPDGTTITIDPNGVISAVGGGSTTPLENSLSSDSTTAGLTAAKGKELNNKITNRVRSITDINGSTFGQKINNAIAQGVKRLYLEEYGDYSLGANDNINYQNIEIIGNASTIRSSLPDRQKIGHNVIIKDVKFVDTATSDNNSVFMLTNSKNVLFENCTFSSTLLHVFRLFGENGNVITNLKIKDCKFIDINIGLTFYNEFDNIVFEGNEFTNVKENVISGVGEGSEPGMTKRRFVFNNNVVNDCSRMIIEIKRSDDIVVTNNDFRFNDYFAVSLVGCKNIIIKDNMMVNRGIELHPEAGSDYPVYNVNIQGNTFKDMTDNAIILNSHVDGSTIHGVNISENNFLPMTVNLPVITYAGVIPKITDISITNNVFDRTSVVQVKGVFKGNTMICRDTNSAVEALDEAIITNNIVKPAEEMVFGYGSLIKLSGNDVIIDSNILKANNKFFSCISDQGNVRLRATITNNKFMNAETMNVGFQSGTTFLDIQGNSFVGTNRCDGTNWNNAQPIATNIGRGIFANPGDPNSSPNPNFGRAGSLCMDTTNYKLYVKEKTSAPYWVLK